tara:strand:- start:53 stop:373 length:321 start_codon:yes stop_codon:yes gene_type:complete
MKLITEKSVVPDKLIGGVDPIDKDSLILTKARRGGTYYNGMLYDTIIESMSDKINKSNSDFDEVMKKTVEQYETLDNKPSKWIDEGEFNFHKRFMNGELTEEDLKK